MYRLICFLVVAFGCTVHGQERLRVCYYSNWSQYRPGIGEFFPSDIDPFLCTHVIFAFATFNDRLELSDHDYYDIGELYPAVQNLKLANPNLKTLLAIGGWNEGSWRFYQMVNHEYNRENFVKTSVTFLRDHGFDGLDLDWEYPADKNSLVILTQDLMQEFKAEASLTGRPRLLLTAAVPAGVYNIDKGYNVPELNKNLDFINLMSYDLNGDWDRMTGHNSPLFSRQDETGNQAKLNVAFAANYWLQEGASRDKLVIGLATYGRGFLLQSTSRDQIGDPAVGASYQRPYTKQRGYLAYYEICPVIHQGTRYWDDEGKVPYLVINNEWIGYDDVESITYKLNWIRDNNFAGAMVWNIDLDDFRDICGQGKYPLTRLMKTILGDSIPPSPSPGTVTSDTGGTVPSTTTTTTTMKTTTTNDPGATCSTRFSPHPTDCGKYYECGHGISYLKSCPLGLHFDRIHNWCASPTSVNCQLQAPTSTSSTTQVPTTKSTATQAPTTKSSTTQAPTTRPSTTQAPTTQSTTSQAPTTKPSTTQAPTTRAPTTQSQTQAPSTQDPSSTDPPLKVASCPSRFAADPTNCNRYYECTHKIRYHKVCSPGLYWSTTLSTCDWADNVDCKTTTTQSSLTTQSTTTQPSTTQSTTTPSPSTQTPTSKPATTEDPLRFCETRADGFYYSPWRCADYFRCTHKQTAKFTCSGTVWNIDIRQCDWKWNVDCGTRAYP